MQPRLQGIWLVDSTHQDEATGKLSLSGLFDQLEVAEGTDHAAGATVFFAVQNVHGEARLKLVYVDLADDAVILERDVRIDDTTRLETTGITVRINHIPVPHAGTFAWEVYHGDDRLGSTRIEVRIR